MTLPPLYSLPPLINLARSRARFRHWQLRSQIGLSSKRAVYYVGGNGNTQVHKLDTTANESEVVKILTFAPRCLVAKNDWIACGGENGEFVAFPVSEGGDANTRGATTTTTTTTTDPSLSYIRHRIENAGLHSDMLAINSYLNQLSPDDRLQIGLNVDSAAAPAAATAAADQTEFEVPQLLYPSGVRSRSESNTNNNNKSLLARSKSFGKERVNCITLWFPPASHSCIPSGAYMQAVAVLANNDKNVTIVTLEFQDAVEEVVYPDCVNRALISPDGRLLVAICDDPYLYVHERAPKAGITPSLFGRRDIEDFEWRPCAKVHLASQRKNDRSDQRGSFAACFSNTGRYLAVGTQYGVISVFDTATLLEPGLNPLIATFTSSRPGEDVGAIRDMAFCPGPYDLLAWTEHRGRVGIVDIRSNYVSRQILDLDSYDDYEQIMVTERGSIDPRLLQRNSRGDLTLTESTLTEGTNRRASRRFGADFPPPLGTEETSVLDALSEQRRRREQVAARNNSSPGPASVRLLDRLHNRPGFQVRDTAQNRDAAAFRDHRPNSRVSDILEEIHAQRERLRVQSEHLRQHSERVRARRQMLDEPEWLRDNEDAAASRTATRVLAASRPSATTGSNRLQAEYEDNFATDVEAITQNAFEAYVMATDPTINRAETNGDNERPADRAQLASVWSTLLRQRDGDIDVPGSRLARARAQMNMVGRVDREHDDTAGLAWSEDGRVL